jgi:Tol biopolymer transport system component
MKRRIPLITACAAALSVGLLAVCSNTGDLAGTTNDTESGRKACIRGTVVDSMSRLVVGADVTLHDCRAIDSVAGGGLNKVALAYRSGKTTTDTAGRFMFDSVDTGHFYIETNDSNRLGSLYQAVIAPHESLSFATTVQPMGAISGRIDTNRMKGSVTTQVFIAQVERKVTVNSDGSFICTCLPPAVYTLRLLSGGVSVNCALDSLRICVPAGDTADVGLVDSASRRVQKIVFAFGPTDTTRDIWSVNPDGSGAAALLTLPGSDEFTPRISPDGHTIAFVSNASGTGDIWLMNSDGSNPRRIADNSDNQGYHSGLSWFTDGKSLAYAAGVDNMDTRIYRVDTNGANRTIIIDHTGQHEYQSSVDPVLGRYVAYIYDSISWSPNTDTRIFDLVNSTDTTIIPGSYGLPRGDFAWTWDATKILLRIEEGPTNVWLPANLYIMNRDGSALTRLTSLASNSEGFYNPRWSPGGTQIVVGYRNTSSGRYSLYIMDSFGTNQKEIFYSSSGRATWPDWGWVR